MADINKDGKKDIILTNGDNADYSLKPKIFMASIFMKTRVISSLN
jgi:hypothetical protein